jgi:putative Mg2+ transporter-C (MgtC) family protein
MTASDPAVFGAVWESAAIGMAAGSGLLLLAVTVTAIHFHVVISFSTAGAPPHLPVERIGHHHVSFEEGRGVMGRLLTLTRPRHNAL